MFVIKGVDIYNSISEQSKKPFEFVNSKGTPVSNIDGAKIIINHPIIKKFNMKINFRSIWHPGFLARGYDDRKFETWKSQLR